MKLRAEIYYDAVDFINKNLEASKRYGFESSMNYLLNSRLDIKNTFTFAKAKMREGHYKNKEIPGVPSITNTIEINMKVLEKLSLYTNLYYKGSTRMVNDTKNFQVKMPEYYLLNAGFKGNLLDFNYMLEANNLLNKSYYNYAVASASTYNSYNTYPLSEFNVSFKITKIF
jgi:iron complex outermembrane receptor protein